MYPAAAVGSVCRPCGGAITGRKHAWMLGFERKRINPHEKYDHPAIQSAKISRASAQLPRTSIALARPEDCSICKRTASRLHTACSLAFNTGKF